MAADAWIDEEEGQNPLISQVIALASNPMAMVRRRWLGMLGALFVGLVGTAAGYHMITPTFEARATVLVSSQQIPDEFVTSTVQGLDSLANVNALMGEVVSKQNLSELIIAHDLYPAKREKLPLADVIDLMRTKIVIDQQQHVASRKHQASSSIFGISFQSTDQSKVAVVANGLAAIFIDANLAKRTEQARVTTQFLKRELAQAETDMRAINAEITDFHQANRGAMPGDREAILRKLERLEVLRQTLTRQIESAEERVTLLMTSESPVGSAQSALMQLRMELADQLALHTDEHPNVITLRRRIEVMEDQLSEVNQLMDAATPTTGSEAVTQLSLSRREVERLRAQLAETEAEARRLDAVVNEIPDNEEALAALEERASVLRETYLEFLRKVQDAELAESLESAQQGARVSILDSATTPSAPERSPLLIAASGILVSLGLAIAAGLLLELIDPIILSAAHFEALGPDELLGSVCKIG